MVKVKVFLWAGPERPLKIRYVKASGFFMAVGTMKVVGSSPLRTGRLYPQEYPGTHFERMRWPQGTWFRRMATEKIPSDTTGDWSRDLPTSSAAP
jgi:hypothetical protein